MMSKCYTLNVMSGNEIREGLSGRIGQEVFIKGRIISSVITSKTNQPVILVEFGSQPTEAPPVELVISERLLKQISDAANEPKHKTFWHAIIDKIRGKR